VPFSIFVSLPLAGARHGALRLAEAVLHETMHLQLSLIERIAPAIRSNDAQLYSPWLQTMRPVQSILHGLYVFAVIDAAHGELANRRRQSLTPDEVLYFAGRRKDIEQAILQVSAVRESTELTPFGQALVTRLLRSYA
jgi:HEXXH motif-containing protein